MRGIKKVVSLLLIAALMIGIVPVNPVYADANAMAAEMINFFKTANEIKDVNGLSTDEIHVYAVFVSNFCEPGKFTLNMLNDGPEAEALAKKISEQFFNNTDSKNVETIRAIHKKVYDAILKTLNSGEGTLYGTNSTSSTTALTGIDLLKKMTNGKSDSIIYYGPSRYMTLDLSSPAVQGAFKILSAYSVDFMLGSDGLAKMTALYTDGFGNIWGAYMEKNSNTGMERPTENKDLKLVMPACLNPVAFTSFAASVVDGTNNPKPTQATLKLPLNNAFAMGAFVNTKGIINSFADDVTPYYNIYEKLPTVDTENLLNIYGISSPLNSVLNTNAALGTDLDMQKNIPAYFKNGVNTVYPGSTYIVLANNLARAESKFNKYLTDIEDGKFSGVKVDTRKLINYLYGTLRVNCEIDPKTKESKNVADTLYYFGTSDNNIEWKTDFSDIGMLGASMFMNTNTSFYSESVMKNKLTTKLVDLFNKYPNIANRSLDKNNIVMLRTAANYLATQMGKTDSLVTVDVPNGLGQLVYMVSNIDINTDNYATVKTNSANYITKTTLDNVPASVSALLSLTGAVVEEHGSIAPSLLTPATGALGAATNVSPYSIVNITNNKWWITPIPTKQTSWIYSLTYNDSYLWDDLMNWKVKFDASNLILGVNVFGSDYGYIDKLAANPNMQMFYTLHAYTLFSTHPLSLSGSKPADKIETTISGTKITYDINNFVANGENNWPGVFFGYLVDVLQMDKASKVDSQNKVHFDIYSFQSEFLPVAKIDVTGGKLDLSSVNAESGVSDSEEKTLEEIQKDLVKKIYGIVSDGQNDYRDRWIKSTIDGWLLTIHRTMTGSWLANMSTVSSGSGSTYQGIVGYIQTPALEDLPFTSWMMKNYMQIYVLVLVLIVIFLVIMVLLRMRTWQQGIAIFLFMSIALLLPNILIGNTINVTNKITDSIYSDRFDFWALTQHQQSLESLQSYTKGSKEAVIANTMEKAKEIYSSDAGVRVKWMSPKKSGVFQSLFTNTNMSDSFATNLTIFKWLFSSFVYESEFVGDDPMATYLYRPYNSIVTAGSEYYALGEQSLLKINQTTSSGPTSNDKINKTVTFESDKGQAVDMTLDVYATVGGIYDKAKSAERDKDYEKMFYAALINNPEFFKEENFTKILYNAERIEDIKTMRKIKPEGAVGLWGMGNPDLTSKIFTKAELSAVDNDAGVESNLDVTIDPNMSFEDANLATFLLNTESPYYYFYSVLKYQYGNGKDFKGSLLDKDVFKVQNQRLLSSDKSANGNIRDFLDLEGLFTYTIPYLTVCNDYVYDWTNLNGTRLEAFDFKEAGAEDNIGDATASDAYFESRKLKENMYQVWNMYSPWVDQLNSLDIYNKKVRVGSRTVKVENTLNPSYYLIQGRPMIFSEADMYAKGYKVSDLSDIEIRMQRVLATTYKDMMYLVNYYDLDDDVLLGAAAMYATFNFNREFSQANVLGESVMIYPQSFEMKNFNHDAFMRLALLNSTGETVFASKDLYERVFEKTSIFTGLLLLVEDVLAIIVIPTLKLAVLLMLLFLGLLLCLACVLNPPEKIVQTVMKSLMLPTMLFTVATVIFSFVVSLVVGEGLTAYVGSQNISLATNDPTITILLLIFFGVLFSIALLVIIKMMFDTFKSYGMATLITGVGLLSSVTTSGAKAVATKIGRMGNTVGGAALGGMLNGKEGMLEGAIHGAQGGKLGSMISSRIREKRGAEAYAKAMGVKDVGSSIDEKASKMGGGPDDSAMEDTYTGGSASDGSNNAKEKIGLNKEGYSENSTMLGRRLEDIAYLKHKALDMVNAQKHTIARTADNVVSSTKSTMTKARGTVNSVVSSTSTTLEDVTSGNYAKRSIMQAKNKSNSYSDSRVSNDLARSVETAINKSRNK